jgi:hypothetical protein
LFTIEFFAFPFFSLVSVFGVRSVLFELRADPDIVQENEYKMNEIMRSCCRVLRRGAPHSLGLEEFEVLLNLLTEAADETIEMYVTSIARFVQPTLNTLRLWCSYLLVRYIFDCFFFFVVSRNIDVLFSLSARRVPC